MEEAKDFSDAAKVDFRELLARVDNDRELLHDLLSIFQEEFPRYLQALQAAVQREDCKQTAVVAHTLKGMLSNLAITRAAASSSQLEQLARGNDRKSLKQALAAFEREVDGLLPEVEGYMAEAQP